MVVKFYNHFYIDDALSGNKGTTNKKEIGNGAKPMNLVTPGLLIILCFGLVAVIFAIDLAIPLGVAGGVPYIVVVLITLYFPRRRTTIFFALVASALTIAGFFLSPPGGEMWKVLDNRFLALLAIASTAAMVLLHKHSKYQLLELNDQLESKVLARTKELEDAQHELRIKDRLAVLGQLTATVSHELRNPLGAITTSLYVLKKKLTNKDEYIDKTIQRIDRNVMRCDQIVDELLDFTRSYSLNLASQPLDEWLRSVLEEYELPATVRLKSNFLLEGVSAEFDASRLQRAVVNVLDNAAQSIKGEQGAPTTVNPEISVTTGLMDGRLQIVVEDNGPGITEENIEKIFVPLFSTKSFGVGLGMSAIKKIMEEHEGGISVTSEPNTATRIVLWIPHDVQKE